MFLLIQKYINNLTINDVNNFAIKNNIYLNNNELDFTYNFIKNNYEEILNNHGNINLEKYKEKYTQDNYDKISQLLSEYINKYKNYL